MNEKIRHLREKLKSLNLDGMIVSNPVSIKYLTNINLDGLLLITRKENIFLTYSMYIEMVKATVTINDEVIVADFRDIDKDEYENFFLFCENVGFEENFVTYREYQYLKQKYKINNPTIIIAVPKILNPLVASFWSPKLNNFFVMMRAS